MMSNSNSSFHSALSTPDSSTFENTLVDSTIKHLLTRDNLAVHSSRFYKEFKDERMMQYIDRQQLLVQEQQSIWFKRKSMINKVGYNGNHLGHFYILKNVQQQQQQQQKHERCKRMLGRIAALFLECSNIKRYHGQPRRIYDDKEAIVLVAIGYDEWV